MSKTIDEMSEHEKLESYIAYRESKLMKKIQEQEKEIRSLKEKVMELKGDK